MRLICSANVDFVNIERHGFEKNLKFVRVSYKNVPLSLLMVEYMRPTTRAKESKMARVTRSLLKVLRMWLCMRTAMRMMLPTIPSTETTSFTRQTHPANS